MFCSASFFKLPKDLSTGERRDADLNHTATIVGLLIIPTRHVVV
jgi:hypothetical protein